MIALAIDMSSLESFGDDLKSFEAALDQGMFWNDVIPFLSLKITEVFETKGYGQWKSLSPAYSTWKAKNYPDKDILRLTDTYYDAATQPGNSNNILEITGTRLFYGVKDIEYAGYHESGTKLLPTRSVFELLVESEPFRQELGDILSRSINNLIDDIFKDRTTGDNKN